MFPIQYLSLFDSKDLIGQARELSGGEGEGVKCVWEEEADLEFVADELNIKFNFTFMRCLGPLMNLPKIKKFKKQKNSFHQCLSAINIETKMNLIHK